MYAERKRVLNGESMRNSIMKMITDFVEGVVNRSVSEDKSADEWNYDEINELLLPTIPIAPVAYDENIKIILMIWISLSRELDFRHMDRKILLYSIR